jgi:hypothetical protein
VRARRGAIVQWCLGWLALGLLLALLAPPALAAPDPSAVALTLFEQADDIGPFEGDPPAAAVHGADRLLGYAFLTDAIAPLPAYSGKPVSVLVGIDLEANIVGARIIAHEEPILVVGIAEEDLARYVDQYRGASALTRIKVGGRARAGEKAIDGISGATITVMVINASLTRAARAVAASRGLPHAASAAPSAAVASAPRPGPAAVDSGTQDLWVEAWTARSARLAGLAVGLAVLTVVLVLQDWITRYPRFIGWLRVIFLLYTLVFIGWYSLAQLSVVNVFTFLHAIMGGFAWDTFLIEPLMFVLWAFVAVTLLLWGRGVYCGWLCPFGALQELVNKAAVAAGVRQLAVPPLVHERLIAIKYVALVLLFGLSLHATAQAVRYAEIEPFKTAIILRFDRELPYVLYAVALVAASVVNGKLFCKYLCPLGAALAIGSHFRIFDWLHRRRECGRPCQTCGTECSSQAIRPTGEINANECHYCLDCQVTFWNPYKCPPLVERRRRFERRGQKVRLTL